MKDYDIIAQLRMVSWIGFITAFTSAIILVAVYFLSDASNKSYADLIISHKISKNNLIPALIISGSIMSFVVCTGSWFFALYTSFKFAGPLYRFSRNFEIASKTNDLLGIRQGDHLHEISDDMLQAADNLHMHYDELYYMITDLKTKIRTEQPCNQVISKHITELIMHHNKINSSRTQ